MLSGNSNKAASSVKISSLHGDIFLYALYRYKAIPLRKKKKPKKHTAYWLVVSTSCGNSGKSRGWKLAEICSKEKKKKSIRKQCALNNRAAFK